MKTSYRNIDRLIVAFLLIIAVAVPFSIYHYNQQIWNKITAPGTRIFHLTGHTDKGWIVGEVKAYDVMSFQGKNQKLQVPVLRVSKGERVILRLSSSDVIHGFSLKDYGIFIMDGIMPGKVAVVEFVADETGTFTFTCNSICGDKHEEMKGLLVVTA